jgi:hypothetical protein
MHITHPEYLSAMQAGQCGKLSRAAFCHTEKIVDPGI